MSLYSWFRCCLLTAQSLQISSWHVSQYNLRISWWSSHPTSYRACFIFSCNCKRLLMRKAARRSVAPMADRCVGLWHKGQLMKCLSPCWYVGIMYTCKIRDILCLSWVCVLSQCCIFNDVSKCLSALKILGKFPISYNVHVLLLWNWTMFDKTHIL